MFNHIAVVFPEISADTFKTIYCRQWKVEEKDGGLRFVRRNDLTLDDILPIDTGLKGAVKKPCTVEEVTDMKIQRFLTWGTMEDITNSSFRTVVDGYLVWRFELDGNLPTGIFNELAERGYDFYVYWASSPQRDHVGTVEFGKLFYSSESRRTISLNEELTILEVNEILFDIKGIPYFAEQCKAYREEILHSLKEYLALIEREIKKYPADNKARIFNITDPKWEEAKKRINKYQEIIYKFVDEKPVFTREDTWTVDLHNDRTLCAIMPFERESDKAYYTMLLYNLKSLLMYAILNLTTE